MIIIVCYLPGLVHQSLLLNKWWISAERLHSFNSCRYCVSIVKWRNKWWIEQLSKHSTYKVIKGYCSKIFQKLSNNKSLRLLWLTIYFSTTHIIAELGWRIRHDAKITCATTKMATENDVTVRKWKEKLRVNSLGFYRDEKVEV